MKDTRNDNNWEMMEYTGMGELEDNIYSIERHSDSGADKDSKTSAMIRIKNLETFTKQDEEYIFQGDITEKLIDSIDAPGVFRITRGYDDVSKEWLVMTTYRDTQGNIDANVTTDSSLSYATLDSVLTTVNQVNTYRAIEQNNAA